MEIEEVAKIIEESSREIALKEDDESIDSKEESLKAREFIIETVGRLIDFELFNLGALVLELGEEVFSDEEYPDRIGFYDKLEGNRSLNAIRKLAEIKKYLEAQNSGELQEKPVAKL